MFPWMSPALAKSMTFSQFGKNFREEASNLPFVPIIVNDADLAKMTENVIKEAEQVKSHQLQYYKDVVNQDLPQPLKDMFQPLYCKLCILSLSSPVVAKDHYSGKRHKKAVEGWLVKNSHLSTSKQRREAGAGGGPVQHPSSGTVVKTPGGGLGLTGPINGYIMKHNQSQSSAQPKVPPSAAAPPPPSLLSLNFGNNTNSRKRPAPPTAPSISSSAVTVNPSPTPASSLTAQQQPTQSLPKPNFIGPQKPDSITAPINPKPPLSTTQSQDKSSPPAPPLPTPTGSGTSSNISPSTAAQHIIQTKTPDEGAVKSASNASDFQAKKPRRDDDEPRGNVGSGPVGGPGVLRQPGVLRVSPVSGTEVQGQLRAGPTDGLVQRPPGAGPQQQQRNSFCGERERSGGSGNGGGPPPKSVCEICNVQLSSKVMAEQHFNGKNHKAKLAALQGGVVPSTIVTTIPSTQVGGSSSVTEKSTFSGGCGDDSKNIVNKLLASSSQSSISSAQQIAPPEEGNGSSFGRGNNPFHQQHFNKPRGGGSGGGGRGGGHQGGRGGGQHFNNSNRGGGSGGGRGRGGGPPFRNNNANNSGNNNNNRNNNNFNTNNRFNNKNNSRGRGR